MLTVTDPRKTRVHGTFLKPIDKPERGGEADFEQSADDQVQPRHFPVPPLDMRLKPSTSGAMAQRALIGNRVAPARFIIFFLLLLAGTVVGAMLSSWWLGVMIGFDLAALVFIASCIPFFSHTEKEDAARGGAE